MLYRVLKRANLIQYYDAFISQGGDDLYQLCEAGEDEFLEIMVLVGMSKKPLHVRRLQKALHEWATNPGLFQESESQKQLSAAPKGSILAAFLHHSASSLCAASKPNAPLSGAHSADRPVSSLSNNGHSMSAGNSFPHEHSFRSLQMTLENNLDGFADKPSSPTSENSDQESSLAAYMNSSGEKVASSPNASGAQLLEAHVKKIEKTAEEISVTLPYYAPKPLNMKKAIDKEIDEAMNLPEDDPNRMDYFRKYSAIYGRFDSKRRGGKQMNFHEVCINEAAAQLCKHRPTLLTRREELFILARQVVREAGFQYSKGSRPKETYIIPSVTEEVPTKMPKMDLGKSSAVQDLSYSRHKFLQPVSVNIGSFQDVADNEADASLVKALAASYGAIRSERSAFKVQQNCAPRKVTCAKADAPGDENGAREEIDEQREWQREVGLDSLNVLGGGATESTKGGTILHGSSIIQALREGMKGAQSKNYFIKKEADS